MLSLILLITAAIFFLFSTINWPPAKFNLQSAGLFAWVLSILIGHSGWSHLP